MPAHIKLYGSKAERFEAIKRELSNRLGYEPSNPEVIGILMAGAPIEEEGEGSRGAAGLPLSR